MLGAHQLAAPGLRKPLKRVEHLADPVPDGLYIPDSAQSTSLMED